jgi:peptide/nickel transport system ATP-binding protein
MKLIDGLRAQLGFASILISHDLQLVAAHCKRIGVLQGGGLVEEGPAADVLLAPRHPCTRALIAALPGLTAARRPAPRAVAMREHAAAVRIQDQDDPERRRLPPAPPGPRSAGADEPLVTVAHLTKRYHRQTALRDVSFTIGRGEVLGLVGESGSAPSAGCWPGPSNCSAAPRPSRSSRCAPGWRNSRPPTRSSPNQNTGTRDPWLIPP